MKNITLLLLAVLILAGCSTKRETIGAADEIMIVVSEEHKDAINSALSEIFNDTLYTPKPEPVYKFVNADPIGFNELKRHSNLRILKKKTGC